MPDLPPTKVTKSARHDQLMEWFSQQGYDAEILEWGQSQENARAHIEGRSARQLDIHDCKELFCAALLRDPKELSAQSAQALLRRLKRRDEERNIGQLIDRLYQRGFSVKIHQWRQRIENKEAEAAGRPSRMIAAEKADTDFRHALLTGTKHSESAEDLLRKINRPASLKKHFTIHDAWSAADDPPFNPSPYEKAYLDFLDQQEARLKIEERGWPGLLLKDSRKLSQQAEGARISRQHQLTLLRQARVLEDMATSLGEWLGREDTVTNTVALSQDNVSDFAHKYGMLIMRAMRNGLQDHHVVKVFVSAQILTANRKLLSQARCGLGKTIKTYKDPKDVDIDQAILLQHLKGLSLRQIAGFLTDQGLFLPGKSLSHTTIHNRLKQLQQELPWLFKEPVSARHPMSRQPL